LPVTHVLTTLAPWFFNPPLLVYRLLTCPPAASPANPLHCHCQVDLLGGGKMYYPPLLLAYNTSVICICNTIGSALQ
jgi:hypothetical protein